MDDTIHREGFRVASYDVDPAERLAPRALCAFLQETAGRDVARRGFGMRLLIDRGLAWVLQRLTVEVARWPEAGEEIGVETRARGFTRAVAERDFRVTDAAGQELARATSRWAVVDFEARRAVRLPEGVADLPAGPLHELAPPEGGIPDADPPDLEERFGVRHGDLDVVGHVNNTRYVEWALETVPADLLESKPPRAFDVLFRREAGRGASILSRSRELAPEQGGRGRAFAHALIAEAEVLARALSRW
jgi:acyl-ACP thioesterase